MITGTLVTNSWFSRDHQSFYDSPLHTHRKYYEFTQEFTHYMGHSNARIISEVTAVYRSLLRIIVGVLLESTGHVGCRVSIGPLIGYQDLKLNSTISGIELQGLQSIIFAISETLKSAVSNVSGGH